MGKGKEGRRRGDHKGGERRRLECREELEKLEGSGEAGRDVSKGDRRLIEGRRRGVEEARTTGKKRRRRKE